MRLPVYCPIESSFYVTLLMGGELSNSEQNGVRVHAVHLMFAATCDQDTWAGLCGEKNQTGLTQHACTCTQILSRLAQVRRLPWRPPAAWGLPANYKVDSCGSALWQGRSPWRADPRHPCHIHTKSQRRWGNTAKVNLMSAPTN